jgi:hypothetical protein
VLGKARFPGFSTASSEILTHSRGTKDSPGIPEDVVENPSEIIGLLFLWNSLWNSLWNFFGMPEGFCDCCELQNHDSIIYDLIPPGRRRVLGNKDPKDTVGRVAVHVAVA